MSRRHTWSFSRSNRSRSAAFQMKYLRISDFLDNVKLADSTDTWNKDSYGLVPQNTPLTVSAGTQKPMPLNTKVYPISARNVNLAKLNYYSLLYDFYMVDSIVIQYIPGVSVSTPGFMTFHYEPNQTFSPLLLDNQGTVEANFDWTSYAARQKYGVTFPVWQPQTMVIRPKKYWMRTIPAGGQESIPFNNTRYAPDPLCDYGCFYWHSDEKSNTAGKFELYGLINIYVSVKFRDFSFGRTNSALSSVPNKGQSLYTNNEGLYSFLKNNSEFISIITNAGLTWETFLSSSPEVQAQYIAQVFKTSVFSNIKEEI